MSETGALKTSDTIQISKISEQFRHLFKAKPLLVKAPGRINLIGEHTDYNNGFVLPAAIDKYIYFALSEAENTSTCCIYSMDKEQHFKFSLDSFEPLPAGSWQNYILGVVSELQKAGFEVRAFQLVFGGNIPEGAGLSSSAALECGLAKGLATLFNFSIDNSQLALIAQQAEHNFVGVKCGIMDQFASLNGRKDQVMLLDCESLNINYFPLLLEEYSLVLCNSNVTHELASSQYNVRRSQCEEGVTKLQKYDNSIQSLRDVSLEFLQKHQSVLDSTVYKRCHYIITENQRVHAFCEALQEKRFEEAGELLYKAHAGMQHEYEITCPEIDFLVESTKELPEVLGARMMGGGFGGCTLNLMRGDFKKDFTHIISERYKTKYEIDPTIFEVNIANGVTILS